MSVRLVSVEGKAEMIAVTAVTDGVPDGVEDGPTARVIANC
jgi:hypothetical protein